MAEAAVKEKPAAAEERELTDGFHLIIDALKLNGLNTIYGVPGIPITDFGRMAHRGSRPPLYGCSASHVVQRVCLTLSSIIATTA